MVSYIKIRNTRIAVGGIAGGLALGVMLTISLMAQNKAPQWMVGLMIGTPPIILGVTGYALGHNFSPEWERLQKEQQQKLETAIAPIAAPKPEPMAIVKHSSPDPIDVSAQVSQDEHIEQEQPEPTEPSIDLFSFPPNDFVAVGGSDTTNTNELLPDWLQ